MIKNSGDIFGRVVTAMVTPFDDSFNIDEAAVERIVEHLIAGGTSSIVVAGTTGESPTLEDSEKAHLLSLIIKIAEKRVKIIMGAGSNDTRKTVKAAKQAEDAGADGLLIVAPYYNKPNQEGLKAHFGEVAKATALPIMLYNIPGRTGISIAPETTLALSHQYPNIVALKDSTGNVEQAQDIARLAPPNLRIYSGDDNLTLPFLSVGACGVVSVASHIVGNEIKSMIDAYIAGKNDEARAIHYLYLPLFKNLFIAPNPTCVKYALSKMGLCKEQLRLPLVPLSEPQKGLIDELIGKAGSDACGSHSKNEHSVCAG
ncbi:MAG: 4-hydroxy-tetrahydrodipicolinate synthase [Candidatus Obscuribacterales bacterium]|nr:4-hydroxy-tetrahydrodipicolinate synthase [Candidatus Obscuribacterales bacterium]